MYSVDKETIIKAAKGDTEAFERLLTAYEKLVYNIALQMLQNQEDARDVTQDVFLKVFTHLKLCKNYDAVKSWICKITTNVCLDKLRKRDKGKQLFAESIDERFDNDDAPDRQYISSEPTPEEYFIRKYDALTLKDTIGQLPEDRRLMIVLKDINGFEYNEISEIAGIPMGTVKSRLARARTQLKSMLKANLGN